MTSFEAKVRFTTTKSCFIAVPRFATKHCVKSENSSNVLLRVTTEKCDVTLSWNGSFSSNNDEIEINSTFAQRLRLEDGEFVVVQVLTEFVSDCEECVLRPFSNNDWKAIAENTYEVELNLMNQIQVISKGFCFPIWINGGNNSVFVEVTNIKPERNLVKLVLNTQLVINPQKSSHEKPTAVINDKKDIVSSSSSGVSSVFKKLTSIFSSEEKSNSEESPHFHSENVVLYEYEYVDTIPESSRLVPLRVLPFVDELSCGPQLCNTLFVNTNEFEFGCDKYGVAKLVRILSPSEFCEQSKKTQKKAEADNHCDFKEDYFTSTYVLIRGSANCPKGCSLVSKSVRKQMGLHINSRIFLEKTNLEEESAYDITMKNIQKVAVIKDLILTPIGTASLKIEDVKRYLRNYLVIYKYLVITNGTLVNIYNCDALVTNVSSDITCFIVTSVDSICHIEIKPSMLQKINTSFGAELPLATLESRYLPITKIVSIGGMENVFAQVFTFINANLNIGPLKMRSDRRPEKQSALLLCGPKGSGKTTLLDYVCKQFSDCPHYVTFCRIECKSLRGKRVDTLQKQWIKEIVESIYRQPSIIIMEDLDIVASAASKPDESEVEALYTRRVALLFIALIKLLERVRNVFGNQFAVVATCKSKARLHPLLVQSRGRHVFQQIIQLLPLTLRERENMLNAIIKSKSSATNPDFLDLKSLSYRCEGYLPVDLNILVDKALHACAFRCNSIEDLQLTDSDFDAAFADFVPMSLRSAHVEQKTNKTWNDIGGLQTVKKALLETVLWPLKYPQLFANCPIRPQSSVLLFGAPGTGKTLIAETLANECGVNFISVKGPELLSKYIGASEQAVRNLFVRAQNAKPCVLFFDEFDAIAARRGHDSTGVTDRVVNQILTQMDGVEALERGVYILAATSRPDLLDAALLRPGRFDKCLYCPIPDIAEREHILTVLSAKLTFKSNVDLKVIAEKTNDFTGADLQSLLYTSQLEALQEALKSEPQLQFKNNSQQIEETGDGRHSADRKEVIYRSQSSEDRFYHLEIGNQWVDSVQETAVMKGNQADCLGVKSSGATVQQTVVAISQEHLMSALQSTKPSVNDAERKRYMRLYEAFTTNRDERVEFTGTSKKTTLA